MSNLPLETTESKCPKSGSAVPKDDNTVLLVAEVAKLSAKLALVSNLEPTPAGPDSGSLQIILQALRLAGIFVTNVDNNGQFTTAYSVFSPGSRIGMSTDERVLNEEAQKRIAAMREQAIKTGETYRGELPPQRTADQQHDMLYRVTVIPTRAADRSIIGASSVLTESPLPEQDLGTTAQETEAALRKQIADLQALIKQNAVAADAIRAKMEFLAVMSHDRRKLDRQPLHKQQQLSQQRKKEKLVTQMHC